MSYIFEALQRAEAERSGGSPPKTPDSLVDLLEGGEPEIAVAPAQVEPMGADPAESPAMAAVLPAAVEPEAAPPQSVPDPPLAAKSEAPGARTFADAKVISPALAADARLVCLTDQGGLVAEKFRVLGLKLRHMRERRKLKRIVVTGTARKRERAWSQPIWRSISPGARC